MIQYIDRHLSVWEDAIQGNLPEWFIQDSNQAIRKVMLGLDNSFTFHQYKHFIDTGEEVALLP